jgi:hypothetical protein
MPYCYWHSVNLTAVSALYQRCVDDPFLPVECKFMMPLWLPEWPTANTLGVPLWWLPTPRNSILAGTNPPLEVVDDGNPKPCNGIEDGAVFI